jgi:putative ABC transport system permease protein
MQMDAPIGKTIGIAGQQGRIIGVVRDFHFNSLHEAISPLIIDLEPLASEYLCINVAREDVAGSLEFIQRQWQQFQPGEEFTYVFFDDMLGLEYQSDANTGRIVLGFTVLAVLVAGLGLFGLAAFGAGRRRREIGIRKVHGASLGQLVRLMSSEYFVLVLISSAIAGPVAYYVMGGWLQGFAYRIETGWYHFLVSTTIVLIIAMLTVSYQAIRAATANPVETLRSE